MVQTTTASVDKVVDQLFGYLTLCGLYFRDEDIPEIDHSIPTALGGKDDLSNKWVYHRHCHDEKTAEDLARIAKHKAAGIHDT